jgi:hypothetical protein
MTEISHDKRFSEVLSHASVLDVILMIRKLLYMLEIIIISDANIVGMNRLKAGIHV